MTKTFRLTFLTLCLWYISSFPSQTNEPLKNFTWTTPDTSNKLSFEDTLQSNTSDLDLNSLFLNEDFFNQTFGQTKREPFFAKYDTMNFKIIPDPYYEGSEEDLKQQLKEGTVRRSFVTDNLAQGENRFIIREKIDFVNNVNDSKEDFIVKYWVLIAIAVSAMWFIAITTNARKIEKHFDGLGYEIVYESLNPFAGQSWIGERSFTSYRIIYYNNEKELYEAIVKTGLLSSVQISEAKPFESDDVPEEEIKRNAIKRKKEKIESLKSEIVNIEESIEKTESHTITLTIKEYVCSEGTLTIEQEYEMPNAGEKALLNGQLAPDGKYKIGFLQTVIIKDGKVSVEDE